MSRPSGFDQFVDLFLLRVTPPDHASEMPYYTTGSIMAAAVMRLAIIGAAAFLLNDRFGHSGWWWTVVMFAAWGLGVYPAYLQYTRFNAEVEKIQEGTLCGACKHFNPTNQLCMIMDVHVTTEEPPCEGEAWEPR
jgi:amino acid permease